MNKGGLYLRWSDFWLCAGAILQKYYEWNDQALEDLQALVDEEAQKQLQTLIPLESGYVRIDYTYGGAKPPVYFGQIADAKKEIPTQGASVIFPLGKSGTAPQNKWWYSSSAKEWKYGKTTG